MRKFRLKEGAKGYKYLMPGSVYDEKHLSGKYGDLPVCKLVYDFPEDWEEVTKPKPLHKDTDLGYFAGLAMEATNLEDYANMFGNKWAENVASDSIKLAKELIKQLNNETN